MRLARVDEECLHGTILVEQRMNVDRGADINTVNRSLQLLDIDYESSDQQVTEEDIVRQRTSKSSGDLKLDSCGVKEGK